MRRDWPLRQLLALLRGVGLIVALFLALVLLQLAPSLLRGGLAGVHDHIVRVATSGVPQDHWRLATIRMYEVLVMLALLGGALFWAQRCLGRRLVPRGTPGKAPPQVPH